MARSSPPPATSGGLREQQRQYTRQRLIEAAVATFDERGYVNARVDDIVKRLGASRATFYLHFKSKADVVRAVLKPLVSSAAPYYTELVKLGDPSWQDLRKWMERLLQHWSDHKAEINAVQQAAVVEPDLASEFVASVHETVKVVGPWLSEVTGMDEAEADLRATVWLLEVERVGFFWLIRGIFFDGPKLLNVLTDSLWAMLHPSPQDLRDR